jgi:predicted CXXCH cytochrome family protein
MTGTANVGTDLTNDHPVNFAYATSLAGDTGLNPVTAPVANLLVGGSVQCSSCHDVHDPTNSPFLRMSNTGSALCIVCHNK